MKYSVKLLAAFSFLLAIFSSVSVFAGNPGTGVDTPDLTWFYIVAGVAVVLIVVLSVVMAKRKK